LRFFARDWPPYRRITLLELAGSWSVAISAVHTWLYDSRVLVLMMSFSSDFSASPERPAALS
jgi:hypothetical protein